MQQKGSSRIPTTMDIMMNRMLLGNMVLCIALGEWIEGDERKLTGKT